MAFPHDGKKFQPNVSGNPAGRPPTKRIEDEFQSFLRGIAKDKSGKELERLQAVMERLFVDTMNGSSRSAAILLDRAFGKAKQTLEHSGVDGGPISTQQSVDVSNLPDELVSGIAALYTKTMVK